MPTLRIDHSPSDDGMSTGSILRQVVKSAHDACLALEARDIEEEKLERAVVISRQRHGDNTGRFFVEENGIGQSFRHLLRNAQMCIRRDLRRFKAASGSGKLCSWALLSAGSKLVIESTTKSITGRSRLQLNVRLPHISRSS